MQRGFMHRNAFLLCMLFVSMTYKKSVATQSPEAEVDNLQMLPSVSEVDARRNDPEGEDRSRKSQINAQTICTHTHALTSAAHACTCSPPRARSLFRIVPVRRITFPEAPGPVLPR